MKSEIFVGFSKNDLKKHSGVSGLKYYLVVMYLRKHLQIFGEVSFTLNMLLQECGYSTKSHNSSSYVDFRKILQEEIIDKGYATSRERILSINPNSVITLYLNKEKSLFFTDDNFVQFSVQEFEKISSYKGEKINKSILAGVYLYIKQFIFNDYSGVNELCRISYPSKEQIKTGIGISSKTTIEKAINILEILELIYIGTDMYMEDSCKKGQYVPTRNVYALSKEDLNDNKILKELELVYRKKIYKKQDVPGTIQFL